MSEIWILGVRITDRVNEVSLLQDVLTKFGCLIRTRLGLHEVKNDNCATGGLILLELTGSREEFLKLENELLKLDGVIVRRMVFGE